METKKRATVSACLSSVVLKHLPLKLNCFYRIFEYTAEVSAYEDTILELARSLAWLKQFGAETRDLGCILSVCTARLKDMFMYMP
jgi:hypothetical protein